MAQPTLLPHLSQRPFIFQVTQAKVRSAILLHSPFHSQSKPGSSPYKTCPGPDHLLPPPPTQATMTFLFDYCTSLLNGLIASILPCYSFFLYVEIRDPFKAKSVCYCFVQIPSVLSVTLRKNTQIFYIGLPSQLLCSYFLPLSSCSLYSSLTALLLKHAVRVMFHNIIVPGTWKALKT